MRLPGILHIDGVVAVARRRRQRLRRTLVAPIERYDSSGRVVWIALPDALEDESVVQRAAQHVAGENGGRPYARLEFVRPGPPVAVVRQVAAEHPHPRWLDALRLRVIHGHERGTSSRWTAAADDCALIHLDLRAETSPVRVGVLRRTSLVVVRPGELRHQP